MTDIGLLSTMYMICNLERITTPSAMSGLVSYSKTNVADMHIFFFPPTPHQFTQPAKRLNDFLSPRHRFFFVIAAVRLFPSQVKGPQPGMTRAIYTTFEEHAFSPSMSHDFVRLSHYRSLLFTSCDHRPTRNGMASVTPQRLEKLSSAERVTGGLSASPSVSGEYGTAVGISRATPVP